jgi:hypothetical protein
MRKKVSLVKQKGIIKKKEVTMQKGIFKTGFIFIYFSTIISMQSTQSLARWAWLKSSSIDEPSFTWPKCFQKTFRHLWLQAQY